MPNEPNPTLLNGKKYFNNEVSESKKYSNAIETQGGRTLWLAGHEAASYGDDIPADFESQAELTFRNMEKTLQMAGGELSDIVNITVYIKDPRNSDLLKRVRGRFFQAGHYPTSTLITISNFAHPDFQIEISGVAVLKE